MEGKPFPIKGRYIALIFLLPWLYLPGVEVIFGFLSLQNTTWYWLNVTYNIYYQLLIFFALVTLIFFSKINWRNMYGSFEREELNPAIKLTAFIFIFSWAAVYAVFYPLSYVFPDFVQWWYIDLPPIVYYDNGVFPVAPNFLSLVSLVILAPVVEELAFRGVLLHRWSEKWGLTKAIIASSLLFGLLHPDPVGAMAFGVAMSVLYLRTQSLWLPMICHALNNLVAWFIELGYFINADMQYGYTLEGFRSQWYTGLIAATVALIWANIYLKGAKSKTPWRLPAVL